jgi:uncharacterized Rossmann fold enzyme
MRGGQLLSLGGAGQVADVLDFPKPEPTLLRLEQSATKYICIVPEEQWQDQVRQNAKREGTGHFAPSLFVHGGTAVIVGSGLSVLDHVEEIRALKDSGHVVIAIKGAHDWLLEHGITPSGWVCMDPQEKIVDCVRHPRKDVCYLVASQAHPSVFDQLKDSQTVMWHAWVNDKYQELIPDALWVGGGSTSGLRALTLMFLQGFRRFILFGFDSCISADGTKRVDGAKAAEKRFTMRCSKEGRDRWVNGAMAAQAMEFQSNFEFMPGIRVKVVGDGLLADIMAERVRLGFNDWED